MLAKTWITAMGLCLAASFAVGCNHIENAVDCHGICDRYKSCFDSNYNTGQCEDRCEKNANDDKDYMSKSEQCKDCIDDKSCASATFNCAAQCAGIVP